MHGNVWEWCSDWHGDYPESDVADPTEPGSGKYRVCGRGGAVSNLRRGVAGLEIATEMLQTAEVKTWDFV
jgi:formylglycine-generating enzyme required for sulfatase activity